MSDNAPVTIVGAGPAGLFAAEILSAAGRSVTVYERMPTVARKLLMAGRGGLNLTHSEPFERFVSRYGVAARRLRPMLEALTPGDLRSWADGLGAETFVGSSGRVFPRAMKASPMLRAWLARLRSQGVDIRTNAPRRLDRLQAAETPTLLALGGASWPRLGSDGAWRDPLVTQGVEVTTFQPANVGFDVAWSDRVRERFAGQALKNVVIQHADRSARGEATITAYGIEGGAIYALAADLREAAPATIRIDLRPDLSHAQIVAKLAHAKSSDSMPTLLRKTVGLSPQDIGLIYEDGLMSGDGPPPRAPDTLAARIKAVRVRINAPRGLERAISTAGGVAWNAVDEDLQLRALPNVYVAGEMLDWEAPTGGYLLQACFATGAWAARAILRR